MSRRVHSPPVRSASSPNSHQGDGPRRRKPRKRDWFAASIAIAVIVAMVVSAFSPFFAP